MSDDATTAPTTVDVVQSLATAADLARQIYLAAQTQNPAADLSQLYVKEMRATALWSAAEDQALNDNPAVGAAQKALDDALKTARAQLANLKDIAEALVLLDNIVSLGTTLSKFLA